MGDGRSFPNPFNAWTLAEMFGLPINTGNIYAQNEHFVTA